MMIVDGLTIDIISVYRIVLTAYGKNGKNGYDNYLKFKFLVIILSDNLHYWEICLDLHSD